MIIVQFTVITYKNIIIILMIILNLIFICLHLTSNLHSWNNNIIYYSYPKIFFEVYDDTYNRDNTI